MTGCSLHTWHQPRPCKEFKAKKQTWPGKSLALGNFHATESQSTWHPPLCSRGVQLAASPVVHTGATSAGCWVKRLGRAEIGRGAATNKPGDIRRGPHGRHVGIAYTPWVSCLRGLMSAVDGSPGGGYMRMQFPAEASGAFSREMQSCPHLHLCLSPHLSEAASSEAGRSCGATGVVGLMAAPNHRTKDQKWAYIQ